MEFKPRKADSRARVFSSFSHWILLMQRRIPTLQTHPDTAITSWWATFIPNRGLCGGLLSSLGVPFLPSPCPSPRKGWSRSTCCRCFAVRIAPQLHARPRRPSAGYLLGFVCGFVSCVSLPPDFATRGAPQNSNQFLGSGVRVGWTGCEVGPWIQGYLISEGWGSLALENVFCGC